MKIPYGETASYGEIADEVAKVIGKERMSSRAVGPPTTQSHINYCAVPQSYRRQQPSYRVRGRLAAEKMAAGT